MLSFLLRQIEPRQRALIAAAVALFSVSTLLNTVAGLGVLPAAYEALRFFIIDANGELGADRTWLALALWPLRFLAPVLTLGFIAETAHVIGLFHLPTMFFRLGRRGNGHVIVAGLGRLGRHLCERLDARGFRVVAVERDPECPEIAEVRRLGIPVIIGDARVRGVLEQARVGSARKLLAVTNDDLVNLDVALAGLSSPRPGLEALPHVTDPTIRAHLERRRASCPPDRAREHPRPFNAYDWVAEALVESRLPEVRDDDLFVVAGFGRFGRAVLRALLSTHGSRRQLDFWVVDPALAPGELAFAEWTSLAPGARLVPFPADMLSPSLLVDVERTLGRRRVHFIVCTDDDAGNMRFAFRVLNASPPGAELNVVLRVFGSFEAREAHEAFTDVSVVEFVELLQDRRPEELPELGERPPRSVQRAAVLPGVEQPGDFPGV